MKQEYKTSSQPIAVSSPSETLHVPGIAHVQTSLEECTDQLEVQHPKNAHQSDSGRVEGCSFASAIIAPSAAKETGNNSPSSSPATYVVPGPGGIPIELEIPQGNVSPFTDSPAPAWDLTKLHTSNENLASLDESEPAIVQIDDALSSGGISGDAAVLFRQPRRQPSRRKSMSALQTRCASGTSEILEQSPPTHTQHNESDCAV